MGTMESWRKAYGAIKDSTKVGLAKINSEFKDLDVAVVKATNHVECPPKERHLRKIFMATSAVRPRADVGYCIHALTRRLAKTRSWTVALKTLIVIHRTLREGDPTFREEFLTYSQRGHILHISNFKDDSSTLAWDCSAWVRTYALFLEERLECFRVLKYDIEAERLVKSPQKTSKGHSRTRRLACDALLEQLPALQQLLFRLIACQPEGAAFHNYLIQYALALVLKESFKIYCAINDGIINLVDLFFDMPKHHAVKALCIYKRAGQQAESLSEFYEFCKGLELARNFHFPTLREPPPSFLTTMEEYIREAPRIESSFNQPTEIQESTPKVDERGVSEEVGQTESERPKERESECVEPEGHKEESQSQPLPLPLPLPEQTGDLLGLDEINPNAEKLDESNALALYLTTSGGEASKSTTSEEMKNVATGWELSLVSAPSSNNAHLLETQLAGGFDKLLLDSLYDDAAARRVQTHTGYGPPLQDPCAAIDPFIVSASIPPPTSVQMQAMNQHHHLLSLGGIYPTNPPHFFSPSLTPPSANPFGDPFPTFPASLPGPNPSLL